MNPLPVAESVGDLPGACPGQAAADAALAAALPMLAELSGATTVLVVRPRGEGEIVAMRVGPDLDPDALASGRTATRPLPGNAGDVVAAWVHEPDEPCLIRLELALTIVTERLARLNAEDQLMDLTARMNSAQQLANMGDYDWHIASDTNRWSDQLYRIYGHEPQSFNPSYELFLAHIHPEDRDRVAAVHQHAYATGEPYEMVERVVRPDGGVRYLSSNGQVVLDEAGRPTRMRGTCIDITDRVLAEQARERIAARFRHMVDSCPDAILVLDVQGRIVQGNRRAHDLLGGDPTGRRVEEIARGLRVDGQGIEALGLDGRPLRLDVITAELSGSTGNSCSRSTFATRASASPTKHMPPPSGRSRCATARRWRSTTTSYRG
ncbi:PAS domain-containing protein [Sporichthya sp.]|uniref:PAS domain-containing protein n=1 Tax=Sporichthya sp. TaxID=65475 RepID=UPI0017FBD189|nr:PAS domain-containing protein [Sporichthya sp.]MBA3741720.1 PAS domain-containing protein [Sporichthya sp.]